MQNVVRILAAAAMAAFSGAAFSQGTPVAIGISGWTGFAPLTRKGSGLFKKNGIEVSIKKSPEGSPLA